MQYFSGSISHYIEQFQSNFIKCTWSVFLKTLLTGPFSFLLSSHSLIEVVIIKTWVWENKKKGWNSWCCVLICILEASSGCFMRFVFKNARHLAPSQWWDAWSEVLPGADQEEAVSGRVWTICWSLHFGNWCSAQNPTHHMLSSGFVLFLREAEKVMPVGIQETWDLVFLSLLSFFPWPEECPSLNP